MIPSIQRHRLMFTFAIATLLAACGSSGGPAAPLIVLTYAPVSGTSPSVTTASGSGSTDSIAVVDIFVTDVLDVLSASFTLDFDRTTVAFLDFDTTGSHLGSDGATVQPIVQQTQTGQLTIGLTRLSATGIDFNGSHRLISVRFTRSASSGMSTLAFGNTHLLDDMTPPQSIGGVQWFGGSFRID